LNVNDETDGEKNGGDQEWDDANAATSADLAIGPFC
jgi:hypothetical protein